MMNELDNLARRYHIGGGSQIVLPADRDTQNLGRVAAGGFGGRTDR